MGEVRLELFFLYGTAGRKLKYDAGVGNHFACGRIFHSTTAARFIFHIAMNGMAASDKMFRLLDMEAEEVDMDDKQEREKAGEKMTVCRMQFRQGRLHLPMRKNSRF